MKLKYFAGGFVVLAILILAVCPHAQASVEDGDLVPLWGPYLTSVSETGITINWKTEDASQGIVRYATDAYYQQHGGYSHVISDAPQQLHHVELSGLSADTKYHYQLQVQGERTADTTFTTLGSESFTFIVYGDSQEQLPLFTQLERHKIVADRIAAEDDISFVLHAGDLVSNPDDLEEWGRFFEAAREMLAETPIFPVLGNHEGNSANYYDAFGVEPWYSFDCGNAHFAMLDSNLSIAVQAEWLAEDLDGDADWKFAVYHHPPYSSSPKNWGGWAHTRTAWEPLFVEDGVNAVFSGHVHAYERYWENGIHYAVLGTGGGPCYKLEEAKIAGYRNSFEYTLAYARVTVDSDQAFMDIIKVADISPDNGEVLHIYPPDTVFERVNLQPEPFAAEASLLVTTRVALPTVGIMVEPDYIDYGDISPGESSDIVAVNITNTGKLDANVTLEVTGADAIARAFFELSLYIDDNPYDIAAVIAFIESGQAASVDTWLQVPGDWEAAGVQEAQFIFWAEAS
jgi:hypothetical protein